MKSFDKKAFNVDQNNFSKISIYFSREKGLEIIIKKEQVVVKPSIVPAAKCDFVSSAGSSNTNSFFEVSGFREINDLFFYSQAGHKIKDFYYVLPENESEVVNIIKEKTIEWMKKSLEIQLRQLQETETMISISQ